MAALGGAFAGCEAVVHCAGINRELGEQTYQRVHIAGTANVVAAAWRAGVRKIVLISFLRARPNCGSGYHESKWAAEEIVQDVFITLMRDPKKYDATRGALRAFLYGVARNRVMKHLERLPREIPLEEKNEDGTGSGIVLQDSSTPAIWAEKRERLLQVRAAVQELPVEFREAVVLCELEEMSYEEAAQMAGCPIGTIRSRLHRGRALLMAKLEMFRGAPRRASVAR